MTNNKNALMLQSPGKASPLFLLFLTLLGATFGQLLPAQAQTPTTCSGDFISVSLPLTELGPNEYVRLNGGPTGLGGGLYPGGVNVRPLALEATGVALAQHITPLNRSGQPDPVAGKIGLISVGMSNTAMEFQAFQRLAAPDPDLNPALVIVNGAQAGQTAEIWIDPQSPAWQVLAQRLTAAGLEPAQVQVAWVKLTRQGGGNFPARAQILQQDLAVIARNLKSRYSNLKIAYYSSRTRGYTYWNGLSPEPVAFETGFAVKWLIEQQFNSDPDLNFDPAVGPVVAPLILWGPYLWIDGLNPRLDGRTWTQADLVPDCTHPSDTGVQKVADQLLAHFKSDTTAQPWFLADSGTAPTGVTLYLPILLKD